MIWRVIRSRSARNLLTNRRSWRLIKFREFRGGKEKVLTSPYGMVELNPMKIHEMMYEKFQLYSKFSAVECSMSGRKYSFEELLKCCRIMAASMQNKLNLHKGDVISIFLPNIPEFPIIFLGAAECGVITSPINFNYTPNEVARQLTFSDAKLVFTLTGSYAIVVEAFKNMNKTLPVVVIKEMPDVSVPPGAADFAELMNPNTSGPLREVDMSIDDVIVLPFSSGTTGLPKGVELRHRNISSNILQIYDVRSRLDKDFGNQDVVLGLLPMFHIYGLTCITLASLYMGATLLTMPFFDPRHFMESIVQKRLSTLFLVPPLIMFFANSTLVKPEMLKGVKRIVNGASSPSTKDVEKLLNKGSHIFIGQGYGMTETSPLVTLFRKEYSHKYGACGVPVISTQLKIVDPTTFKSLGPNGVGEIWVKGPQVMKGYYKNKEATEAIFQDGWLRTGDVAYYDTDGDIFISDRMKDLIKVKGFQVSPAELEELLRTHPKVVEAAVIGVKHPTKGEVPKAYIVLKEGEKATEEEIKDFIKGKVAKYKQLDGGVVFVDYIPKSASGKIVKSELS